MSRVAESVPSHPPGGTAPPSLSDAEKVQPRDIPERPAASVVIRFVGCEAEMVGLNKDFFTLGDAAGCDVPFPPALRCDGQSIFRLGRAADGWRLNCHSGLTYYVNQEVATNSSNLRSGDVIRLAPGGPGFQFTILNQNAESLAKLAARYAPRLVQPGREAAPSFPAPPRTATVAASAETAKPQAAEGRWNDYEAWIGTVASWIALVVGLVAIGLALALWSAEESLPPDAAPIGDGAAIETLPLQIDSN